MIYSVNMNKVFGALLIFLLCASQSFALVISEIIANPVGTDTGCEVIEIYNNDDRDYDISELELFDSGIKRSLSSGNSDGHILAKEYFLLLQTNSAIANCGYTYSGKYFLSNFQLTNTKDSLSLGQKNGQEIDNFSFDKDGIEGVKLEAKEGRSLSKIDNTITESNITLGNVNSVFASVKTSLEATSTEVTIPADSFVLPTYYSRDYFPESEKIYVNAGGNRVALLGSEVEFEGKVVTGDKKQINNAKYFWSFGDGEIGEGERVTHVYKYTGEYVVFVEAYTNGYKNQGKLYVKVVEPNLKINLHNRSDEKFVEVVNNSKEEVDIGGFLIKSYGGEFEHTSTLPKKLLILPNKSINISCDTLEFSTSTNRVVFTYSNGKEIDKAELYGNKLNVSKEVNDNIIVNNSSTAKLVSVMTKENFDKFKSIDSIPTTTIVHPVLKPRLSYKRVNNLVEEKKGSFKEQEKSFTIENNKSNILSKVFRYFGI